MASGPPEVPVASPPPGEGGSRRGLLCCTALCCAFACTINSLQPDAARLLASLAGHLATALAGAVRRACVHQHSSEQASLLLAAQSWP